MLDTLNFLLIDTGNTRLKYAVTKGLDLPTKSISFKYEKADISLVLDKVSSITNKPNAIFISSVADKEVNKQLSKYFQKTWDLIPQFVSAGKEFNGLTNGYEIPEKLGVDRWCAMVAAWQRVGKAVCVIDCGTAITVDVINDKGDHLGGLIYPGVETLKKALIKNTAINLGGKLSFMPKFKLGANTEDGITHGIGLGITAFIRQLILNIQSDFSNIEFVFTGGNGGMISEALEGDYAYYAHLVLEGLAHIAVNTN